MHALQDVKYVSLAPPQGAAKNGSLATAPVDTKGYNLLTIVLDLGSTDVDVTALRLEESEEGVTDWQLVHDSGVTDLPVKTNDDTFWVFEVRLGPGRKRFIDLVCTFGAGTDGAGVAAMAILSEGTYSPNSLADRGIEHLVRV